MAFFLGEAWKEMAKAGRDKELVRERRENDSELTPATKRSLEAANRSERETQDMLGVLMRPGQPRTQQMGPIGPLLGHYQFSTGASLDIQMRQRDTVADRSYAALQTSEQQRQSQLYNNPHSSASQMRDDTEQSRQELGGSLSQGLATLQAGYNAHRVAEQNPEEP